MNRDGISTYYSDENLIANNTIDDFWFMAGIDLGTSANNAVVNNTISNGPNGIYVATSTFYDLAYNNTIMDNTVANCEYGIYLYNTRNTSLFSNTLIEDGVFLLGSWTEHWNSQEIPTNNTVNGRPVHYWKDMTGGTVPANAGEIILGNCSGVTVKDQSMNNGSVALEMGFTSNTTVTNVSGLNATYGIYMDYTTNNTLFNCSMFGNAYGLYLWNSDNNTVVNSTMALNGAYGAYVASHCQDNVFYGNHFADNSNQTYDYTGNNVWNATYPIGGNYWSDYSGPDLYSGPGQNESGSDGVGDTPYTNIGWSGAQDNYPMYHPVTLPDVTPPTVTSTVPANASTGVAVGQNVVVVFSESMDTSLELIPRLIQISGTEVAYTFSGWSTTNHADDTATWTHAAWAYSDDITLNVTGGYDLAGNIQIPYQWNFTTQVAHTATATGPTNTVPTNDPAVVITYNYDAGTTSVNLYYSVNSGTTWTGIGSDSVINGSYPWTLPSDGSYCWMAVGDTESPPAGGQACEAGHYAYDSTAPTVSSTEPADSDTNVQVYREVIITFSEGIDTSSFTFTCSPDPGNWSQTWNSGHDNVTLAHTDFALGTQYWINVTGANDTAGNSLSAPYSFSFVTAAVLDSTAPISSVSPISPYWHTAPAALHLSASDDTGLDNLTLYYRFSGDNTTGGSWIACAYPAVSGTAWFGDITVSFPDGDGYYEFYTIASDSYSNTEAAPTGPDAICAFDASAPAITDNSAASGSTGEDYDVNASVTDLALDSVSVEYWFGSGTHVNTSMALTTAGDYVAHVPLPGNSTETLHYIISAVDIAGNHGGTAQKDVAVADNDAPTAAAGPDLAGEEGDTIGLNGTASSDNIGVVNYTWAFNDGIRDVVLYGAANSHVFNTAGNYTVTLTVRDAAGNTDSDTLVVGILPPAPVDNPDNDHVNHGMEQYWWVILIIVLVTLSAIWMFYSMLNKADKSVEEAAVDDDEPEADDEMLDEEMEPDDYAEV
jgi:parallel beta-helix repeat protein